MTSTGCSTCGGGQKTFAYRSPATGQLLPAVMRAVVPQALPIARQLTLGQLAAAMNLPPPGPVSAVQVGQIAELIDRARLAVRASQPAFMAAAAQLRPAIMQAALDSRPALEQAAEIVRPAIASILDTLDPAMMPSGPARAPLLLPAAPSLPGVQGCPPRGCVVRELGALDDFANEHPGEARVPNGAALEVLGEGQGTVTIEGVPVGPRRWAHVRFRGEDNAIVEGWMLPENVVGASPSTGQGDITQTPFALPQGRRATVKSDARVWLTNPNLLGGLIGPSHYIVGARVWPPHYLTPPGRPDDNITRAINGSRVIAPGSEVMITEGPYGPWDFGRFFQAPLYRVVFTGPSRSGALLDTGGGQALPSQRIDGWMDAGDLDLLPAAAPSPIYATNVPGPAIPLTPAGRRVSAEPYVRPTDAATLFAHWQGAIQGGKLPQVAIDALYTKYRAAAEREGHMVVPPSYRGPFPPPVMEVVVPGAPATGQLLSPALSPILSRVLDAGAIAAAWANPSALERVIAALQQVDAGLARAVDAQQIRAELRDVARSIQARIAQLRGGAAPSTGQYTLSPPMPSAADLFQSIQARIANGEPIGSLATTFNARRLAELTAAGILQLLDQERADGRLRAAVWLGWTDEAMAQRFGPNAPPRRPLQVVGYHEAVDPLLSDVLRQQVEFALQNANYPSAFQGAGAAIAGVGFEGDPLPVYIIAEEPSAPMPPPPPILRPVPMAGTGQLGRAFPWLYGSSAFVPRSRFSLFERGLEQQTSPPSPMPPEPLADAPLPPGAQPARVLADVNVRASWTETSPIIARLLRGTGVAIVEAGAPAPPTRAAPMGWLKIRTPRGVDGYVSVQHIQYGTGTGLAGFY